MNSLFESQHFSVADIETTGKKQTSGSIVFHGLSSPFGSHRKVLALEDGVVTFAGRCNDPASREHKRGIYVQMHGINGVSILYCLLNERLVKTGDYVRIGQAIGTVGDREQDCVKLEFRRNGRRINGCQYLGIDPIKQVFTPGHKDPAEIVRMVCELTDAECAGICDSALAKIAAKLRDKD